MKKPMKKLIVCHDAGGAEIIACWVRRQSKSDFTFCLEGPAAKIFPRRVGEIENLAWNEVMKGPGQFSVVLTGTSWASDLERKALAWAHQFQLPSATFLDHWVNYRKRFETEKGLVTPDELYVYDEIGKEIAQRELKHPNIKIIDNPYWEDTVAQIQALEKLESSQQRADRSKAALKILYCTQPIQDVAFKLLGRIDGYGYDEYEAMNDFLDWLRPELPRVSELRLRQHPSEAFGKYDEFVKSKNMNLKFSISTNVELVDDIAWADWVVGCDTMAMVVALKAERKVLCSIPKAGKKLDIPLAGIERLFI